MKDKNESFFEYIKKNKYNIIEKFQKKTDFNNSNYYFEIKVNDSQFNFQLYYKLFNFIYSRIAGRASTVDLVGCIKIKSPPFNLLVALE